MSTLLWHLTTCMQEVQKQNVLADCKIMSQKPLAAGGKLQRA